MEVSHSLLNGTKQSSGNLTKGSKMTLRVIVLLSFIKTFFTFFYFYSLTTFVEKTSMTSEHDLINIMSTVKHGDVSIILWECLRFGDQLGWRRKHMQKKKLSSSERKPFLSRYRRSGLQRTVKDLKRLVKSVDLNPEWQRPENCCTLMLCMQSAGK